MARDAHRLCALGQAGLMQSCTWGGGVTSGWCLGLVGHPERTGGSRETHRGIEAEGEEMRDTERDRRERLAENGTKTGGEKVREFREAESQDRVCASSGNGVNLIGGPALSERREISQGWREQGTGVL